MVVNVPTCSLEGKVALVTGAGRGIGRGCAIELGKRGASVVVNYVSSKGPAEEVCKIIEGFNNGAKAISIQADVSQVSEINRLFAEAKQAFGKIDIVMSNSGTESWDKTEEITEEKYDHVFNLNARAQFFVGQAAYKNLEDNGRLILMSSIAAGLLGVKDHALYNASKMAVIGMIKSFATDFGKRGITVNGVAPGGIKSDMFTQNAWHYIPGGSPDWPAEKIETLMANHCPLGRCAVPEDVARVVAFLASEDGGWINGKHPRRPRLTTNADPSSSPRSSHYHFRRIFPISMKMIFLVCRRRIQGRAKKKAMRRQDDFRGYCKRNIHMYVSISGIHWLCLGEVHSNQRFGGRACRSEWSLSYRACFRLDMCKGRMLP